ncbi:MAG: aspartate aminotransferase family protein [Gemmatimonadaceae bacterium]
MRNSSAELAPDAFRAAGHQLVDRIADFLATLPTLPVAPSTTPQAVRELIGAEASLPSTGADAGAILAEAAELYFKNSTFNGHPRFFGYITSSAAPIGALADMLSSTVNANCGAWALSPVATEMERQVVRWIAELIGYTPDAGGILVSGGNMANMVALMTGLRSVAGHDVRSLGIAGGEKLAVYASSEVHTWFQKGADICGLGTDAVRSVPIDDALAMDVAALERQIREDIDDGWTPAFVVGTAGTVSTGAIDPLREIGALCREHGIWLHVDGAYGAPAAMVADASEALRALSIADSVAVDPHKWLYAPLEAGCTLVRDPEKLLNAFSFHPVYYRFGGDAEDPPTNYYEWGPQNSRGNRALKVWATMRQCGRDGYMRMISEDIELSRAMHRLAADHDELEALTQSLSITTFRYVPRELRAGVGAPDVEKYLNDLNSRLLERLQAGGEVYLSNAVIGGRFALRACIVNFRTTMADAEALIAAAAREGRALYTR